MCGDISEFSCVSAHLAIEVLQHRQVIISPVLSSNNVMLFLC
jgi:hypothetical protein